LGAAIAVEYLLGLTVTAIYDHNRKIADQLRKGLEEQGAQILSPESSEERSAIVAARFPGQDSTALVKSLHERNVILSKRRDFLRFSPHLYNDSGDVESALSAIAAVQR
jgi:selenocysteine lyase/cysteine desulfurase